MLDDQRYRFLGDALLTTILTGLGELDNPCYGFLVAYWDVEASRR
jgi:hypothetical protein